MNKVRIVVTDDEPLARRGVRQLLAKHEDMEVVGECSNGMQTLRAIEELSPDLLFLDIQMPEMDGFEVLRAAGLHRLPLIVFVTAYDSFAARAFETYALDYLVKPLHVDRFDATIQRVRERLQVASSANRIAELEALLEAERNAGQGKASPIVVVSEEAGNLLIKGTEIDWIEAEDYYSRLHVGKKSYLIRESLSSFEKRLAPEMFIRIHRSAIVRIASVRQLRSIEGGDELVLVDGQKLPVSRRNKAAVYKALSIGKKTRDLR